MMSERVASHWARNGWWLIWCLHVLETAHVNGQRGKSDTWSIIGNGVGLLRRRCGGWATGWAR